MCNILFTTLPSSNRIGQECQMKKPLHRGGRFSIRETTVIVNPRLSSSKQESTGSSGNWWEISQPMPHFWKQLTIK
ncbi:hypothetical protein CEXT_590711 [Caerostris extrusa]|uniref:Uncharacterized protein n=1 Tax=Caerostris extrusa TaxID=172846 RepID=A0AAV4XD76_CAEEX|nr:hypothetical protein CEXT_590711 [Caerostris extrusa]